MGFKKVFIFALAISLLLAAGCTEIDKPKAEGANSNTKKIKIVATIYPMVEFTRQIAGDKAEVIALIPAGAEPHDWEPTAKEMAKIKEADVFVYNGIVEEWAEQVLKSAFNDKRIVVEAIQGIELIEGEGHHHDHDHEANEEEHDHDHEANEEEHDHDHDHEVNEEDHDHEHEANEEDHDHDHEANEEKHEHDHDHILDPHVWLNPVLAEKQVRTIQAALEQADSANKDVYKQNADAYIAKLRALDQEFRTGLNGIKRKEFVVQHAAFGYLAKEYGLTQIPISGLSPEHEPSPGKMAKIVKFSKEHEVKTIFFETLVDPWVAQTIANEIGAKTAVLDPIEGLTEEGRKNNLDYIAIMKKNLEALKQALNE